MIARESGTLIDAASSGTLGISGGLQRCAARLVGKSCEGGCGALDGGAVAGGVEARIDQDRAQAIDDEGQLFGGLDTGAESGCALDEIKHGLRFVGEHPLAEVEDGDVEVAGDGGKIVGGGEQGGDESTGVDVVGEK